MNERPSEAIIDLDAAGRCLDANDTALDLLGVTLAELRAAPPGQFAIGQSIDAEDSPLRAQWLDGGNELPAGTAGLVRGDGTTIRVAFALEATVFGFRARLSHVAGSPHAPGSAFTIGDVLREWRAAERQLTELSPDTPDWARTRGEIELLRGRYQQLFKAAEPPGEEA